MPTETRAARHALQMVIALAAILVACSIKPPAVNVEALKGASGASQAAGESPSPMPQKPVEATPEVAGAPAHDYQGGAEAEDAGGASRAASTVAEIDLGAHVPTFTVASGSVYWAEVSDSSWAIKAKPLAGGDSSVLASTAGSGKPVRIAVRAGQVYVATAGGVAPGIVRFPDGGGPMSLLSNGAPALGWFALEQARLFWLSADGKALKSMPLEGGQEATVSAGLEVPTDAVAFGDWLYILAGSTIEKVPASGGGRTLAASSLTCTPARLAAASGSLVIADATVGPDCGLFLLSPATDSAVPLALDLPDTPEFLQADANYAYFSPGKRGVWCVPIGPGSPAMLASGLESVTGLAQDARNVYALVTEPAGSRIVRIAKPAVL